MNKKVTLRGVALLLLIVLLQLAAVPAFADHDLFDVDPVFCDIFQFDLSTWYYNDAYRPLLAACMMLDSYGCGIEDCPCAYNTMQAVAYGDVYIANSGDMLTGHFFTSQGTTTVFYFPSSGYMAVSYDSGDILAASEYVMSRLLQNNDDMISYKHVSNESIIYAYDTVFAGK